MHTFALWPTSWQLLRTDFGQYAPTVGALVHYTITDVAGNDAGQRTILMLPPGRGSSLGTIVMAQGTEARIAQSRLVTTASGLAT